MKVPYYASAIDAMRTRAAARIEGLLRGRVDRRAGVFFPGTPFCVWSGLFERRARPGSVRWRTDFRRVGT